MTEETFEVDPGSELGETIAEIMDSGSELGDTITEMMEDLEMPGGLIIDEEQPFLGGVIFEDEEPQHLGGVIFDDTEIPDTDPSTSDPADEEPQYFMGLED